MKFSIPYLSGKEKEYVSQAIESRSISGDGLFTKKCQTWFENKFGFKKTFLTTSCTDALEMAAILLDIKGGDEVIVTPYTFIATISAILEVGAMPVFVDIDPETFQMDPGKIEKKITPRTRAILPVHILGLPVDIVKIMEIAKKHSLISFVWQ